MTGAVAAAAVSVIWPVVPADLWCTGGRGGEGRTGSLYYRYRGEKKNQQTTIRCVPYYIISFFRSTGTVYMYILLIIIHARDLEKKKKPYNNNTIETPKRCVCACVRGKNARGARERARYLTSGARACERTRVWSGAVVRGNTVYACAHQSVI